MFGELRSHLSRLRAKRDATFQQDDAEKSGKLLEFYTRVATRILDAERSSIFIVDPETGKVWLKAGTGVAEHGIEVSTEGSIVGKVIETGEIVIQEDLEHKEGAHRHTDEQTGFVTRNMVCVPVRDPDLGETVGAVQALNKLDGKKFGEKDVAFLEELAEHVQTQVSLCFLDQEIYGLSERVIATAKRLVGYLLGAIVVLILVLIVILVIWTSVPALA